MLINCIDGPEFAKRLNKAMGKRETDRAGLDLFSSDYEDTDETLEHVAQETGSSFEWLRALQTYLLGDRLVLVAKGWNRRFDTEGVWLWVRDEKDPALFRGLNKPEAAEFLLDRLIPAERTSRLRLDPLKDAKDVRVPLTQDLVESGGPYRSRAENDKILRRIRPYQA